LHRTPGFPWTFVFLVAHLAFAIGVPARAADSVCGNGAVESGEECDSGDPLGVPECSRFCRRTALEPQGLPFGPRPVNASASALLTPPAVYSPRLRCALPDARDGARLAGGARVRYRIHLCRNAAGSDAFTESQVRAAMKTAAGELADAGIELLEEALVRFTEDDCDVSMDDKKWEDALIAKTPEGVMSVAFVANVFAVGTQYQVGGFCYFGGPLCVNSATFPSLVVHEIGHFFGLAHTHECAYGLETTATCDADGDLLCDTPPDRGPWGMKGIGYCDDGSTLKGSCSGTCGSKVCTDGSRPDGYNWMSYYDCLPGRFSNEQQDFMRCMLDHEMREYNVDYASTTTTTSTTLPEGPSCGDLNGDGVVSASDALGALKAGVGLAVCDLWICDYNGSGNVSAADALAVLQAAVGMGTSAKCPRRFAD
jgi:hypothetical protein